MWLLWFESNLSYSRIALFLKLGVLEFAVLHFKILAFETKNCCYAPVETSVGHALDINRVLNYNIKAVI